MKIKLAAVLFSGVFLTGCLSTIIDLSSSQNYQTKWNGQCLTAVQDIALSKGPKTDNLSRNFLSSIPPTRMASYMKRQGTIERGTSFEVIRIYDNYIHGSLGNWHLRTNLKVLDGPYQGLEVEIPGTQGIHPVPSFFTHSTQTISFTARENLRPSTIKFNQDFLIACS